MLRIAGRCGYPMHELSIAYSLVELAEQSAKDAGASRVLAVHLRLGAMSGVVRGALEFSYEIAAADTLLAGSRLVVKELPVLVHCPKCMKNVQLVSVQRFRCPECDTPSGDIRQGRELEIESIEIGFRESEQSHGDKHPGNARTGNTQRDSQ